MIENSKEGGAIINNDSRSFSWKLLHPTLWATWLGIGFLSVLWLLPRRIRNTLANRLAGFYMKKSSNHKSYAQVNLSTCFPDMSEQEREQFLTRHFQGFFQIMLDSPLIWWGSSKRILKSVELRGFDIPEKKYQEGKSIIFLCSHSMALDVAVSVFSIQTQMQGFYKPFKNPVIDWLMFRTRTKRGARLAARGEGFSTVIKDLKKGMPLFYLSDEDLGREHSVFAPFFGKDKATLAMLPRIVKMTKAEVYPVYSHYNSETGKYIISVFPAMKDYPSQDAVENARRLNEATEETIMVSPEHYLWKLRLFKTPKNEGEKNIYKKDKERREYG